MTQKPSVFFKLAKVRTSPSGAIIYVGDAGDYQDGAWFHDCHLEFSTIGDCSITGWQPRWVWSDEKIPDEQVALFVDGHLERARTIFGKEYWRIPKNSRARLKTDKHFIVHVMNGAITIVGEEIKRTDDER